MWETVEAVLTGEFIIPGAYIWKEKKIQINNISSHVKANKRRVEEIQSNQKTGNSKDTRKKINEIKIKNIENQWEKADSLKWLIKLTDL